jgi:hypothetical protein
MKLPIKTKKDWCIAFIAAFIILYYLSMNYDFRIMQFMMRFAPLKMNLMNYPAGWGNFVIVGIGMTILTLGVLLIKKATVKRIVLAATVGTTFTAAMLFGFMLHTNLIVDTSKNMKATSVWITCYEQEQNIDSKPGDELTDQLIASAIALKAKSDSQQKLLRALPENSEDIVYHIWISYPKKYGQSYDLILYASKDRIYSYHGDGTGDTRVYYEDNGFLQTLDKIIDQSKP